MRIRKMLFPKKDEQKRTIFYFCLSFSLMFFVSASFQTETFAQAKKRTKTKPAARKVKPKTSAAGNLKVTQIDESVLKNLLKRDGAAKPLLVNFWATWCDPCREEFPDLVKIDADFKGKIDFITVSLDDLAEINRDVPKFLAEMKAEMPAYLLKTANEETAIGAVSKDWQGALPFTILFDANGTATYNRQGKVKPEVLRAEIEKVLENAAANQTKQQEK